MNWSEFLDGPKSELELIPNHIHLWQASVLVPPEILSLLGQVLSSDEQARASRFRFERDRNNYVVSRGLLRRLLAAYTNDDPARILLQYGAQGKPAMANSALQFNVSHSGDAVLLGFAIDREIGVDVELMQTGLDFAGLAKTSFSQTEQDAILAQPPDKRAGLFYEYWTCKEACIKADGRGLSAPLDQFSIVASGESSDWREVAVARPGVFASCWRVRILDTISGHAAAVAAAGKGWDLVRMKLEDAAAPEAIGKRV